MINQTIDQKSLGQPNNLPSNHSINQTIEHQITQLMKQARRFSVEEIPRKSVCTLSWSSIESELCKGSIIHLFVLSAYSLPASTTASISAIPLMNMSKSPLSDAGYCVDKQAFLIWDGLVWAFFEAKLQHEDK